MKMVNAVANYIQREYKGGDNFAKAIKALSLPTLQVPGYPKAKAGETAVDPGDVYIWQQDVVTVKLTSDDWMSFLKNAQAQPPVDDSFLNLGIYSTSCAILHNLYFIRQLGIDQIDLNAMHLLLLGQILSVRPPSNSTFSGKMNRRVSANPV